ncbi:hypothetical protein GYA44_03165 [Candidatus Microgenomates bacterium]|nr:hypothetical protein [Candidatus Microgenomates bacterium]
MNCPEYKVIQGKISLLLSAPHVYAHRRPRLNMAYKQGEPLTDAIVEEVCRNIECFGIYSSKDIDYDPNFHKEKDNPYKQEIVEIVKTEKIKFVADIHGLSDEHLYDIGIYYPTKFLRSRKLAMKIKDSLGHGELRGINVSVLRLLDNNQETITEFVASNLRIPAIQIEVARYIREDESLRNSFVENLSKVLSRDFV